MADIERILSKYASNAQEVNQVLGAAFIVKGKGGETLYSSAAGSLKHSGSEPFTQDSVCWIASMTKLATAAAAMQIVEKGLVNLDDDLGKILPDLSNLDVLEGFDGDGKPILFKQSKPITLRLLLSHSSGFGYDTWDPELIKWRESQGFTPTPFSLESLKTPLKFQPGEGWVYGTGLDWAGHLVETLTGLSLEAYMQKHIFQPLGMTSTTFRIASHPELHARRADIGFRGEARQTLKQGENFKPDVTPLDGGGSGLYSTASDYAKLLSALLDDGGVILESTTVRQLAMPQVPSAAKKALEGQLHGDNHAFLSPEYPSGSSVDYTLGGATNLEDIPGKRRAGSLMWSGVTNPRWWWDPRTGIAGVLFTQVLPPGDAVVIDLYDELETAVYQHLG